MRCMHLAKRGIYPHLCIAGTIRALLSCRNVPRASFCVASAARRPVPTLHAPFSESSMNKDQDTIVIAGAARTPVGSFNGALESMSQAPHCAHLRDGTKMGDMKFIDTMIKDGLWDAFNGYHMGNTAENVARQWQITREEQDRFAVASQNKAEAAKKAGKFKDEITPVSIKTRKGETVVADDEYIKDGVTYDSISKLRPAF